MKIILKNSLFILSLTFCQYISGQNLNFSEIREFITNKNKSETEKYLKDRGWFFIKESKNSDPKLENIVLSEYGYYYDDASKKKNAKFTIFHKGEEILSCGLQTQNKKKSEDIKKEALSNGFMLNQITSTHEDYYLKDLSLMFTITYIDTYWCIDILKQS